MREERREERAGRECTAGELLGAEAEQFNREIRQEEVLRR